MRFNLKKYPYLKSLKPLEFKGLCRSLKIDGLDYVDAGTALIIATLKWLKLDSNLQSVFVDAYGSYICKIGNQLEDASSKKEKLAFYTVYVTDNEFISITGQDFYLNAVTGEKDKKMTKVPTFGTWYNMTSIFVREVMPNLEKE